jgi:DNA-binding IclR family transcriptional regulator
MATVLQEKRIKSANRVLEILELFDASRQTVTVMDVARALGVPQSSTSELLGCLVKQGYLQRDRYSRTYAPTARVALLGAWVQPRLFRDGRLLPMMDEIVEEGRHPALLGSLVGMVLRHVHVVGDAVPHAARAGSDHSLLHSPMGKVLLSTFDREIVRKFVHRLNAEAATDRIVKITDLLDELDLIRAQGYATGLSDDGRNAIVAVLLPPSSEEQLSLGILLERDALEDGLPDHVRLLRGAVSSHLGPVLASHTERPRYARAM